MIDPMTLMFYAFDAFLWLGVAWLALYLAWVSFVTFRKYFK